jgi:hypothetical protein
LRKKAAIEAWGAITPTHNLSGLYSAGEFVDNFQKRGLLRMPFKQRSFQA